MSLNTVNADQVRTISNYDQFLQYINSKHVIFKNGLFRRFDDNKTIDRHHTVSYCLYCYVV